MFWIHGGGFTQGSNSEYRLRGGRMAQLGNVVVVNINYRLGMPAHLVLAASYECGSLERKTHIFLSDLVK